MPEGSDQIIAATDDDVLVAIPGAEGTGGVDQHEAIVEVDRDTFGRFRRRFERFRGDADEQDFSERLSDEEELRLELMLLREENARLNAARHKPRDAGTLIDHVRLLTSRSEASEVLDETWSILSECLALREGLDQACVEIQAAINGVRERLGKLGTQVDAISENAPAPDARRTSLSA